MWCENCKIEQKSKKCTKCGEETIEQTPISIYWCEKCNIPIILENIESEELCPICKSQLKYISRDLRPVFPEERLLLELILDKPLRYLDSSVWVDRNRYILDGEVISIPSKIYNELDLEDIKKKLQKYKNKNNYISFNKYIEKFIYANLNRIKILEEEAIRFIENESKKYPRENIVISFSGGKDSTVVADLVIRALKDPTIVHIFGDTTLEFLLTLEYVKRYRQNHIQSIFMVARNDEQDFLEVCKDIGPPARMLRWCCYMFKTGPISRVINNIYSNTEILTFYGVRKVESNTRSNYKRVENDPDSVKIHKQTVAGPIINWFDIDVWLYILLNRIDFNDAYRLGYNRVGCWCCPNSGHRDQFLSKIYMPEKSENWRNFLIEFAKKIGKPDPEEYVDSGNWKARQGGQGLEAAEDVKIKSVGCTTEENARIYNLNKPVEESFYDLFIPFGIVSKDLGRKILDERLVLDMKSKLPMLSIQPFGEYNGDYSVKIAMLQGYGIDELERQIEYQIKKYNACRSCLKCESLCKYEAISIRDGVYRIDNDKCKRCKMCVTSKYIEGGCLMEKYLKTLRR